MSARSTTRYPFKTRSSSSHHQLIRAAGPGENLVMLDVGCAGGFLGQELQSAGWRVIGIELDEQDARGAAALLDEVHHGTLESTRDRLPASVDAITFADVLEHLVDPLSALDVATQLLAPGGRLFLSIPNVAHASVRLQLLSGRFTYSDRGILDRTHVRFFTRKTAIALVREAGFEIDRVWGTPAPIELVWPRLTSSLAGRLILRINDALPLVWPTMFSYQILICARRP